jgi:hypothetical protein
MPLTTTRLALPYPVSSDPDNVPGDMANLANRLDAILGIDGYGTLAARPAAGNEGFTYFATDQTGAGGTTGVLYYDNGSSWVTLNPYYAWGGTGGLWGVATSMARSDHTHTVTVRTSHTYQITGPISVYSGAAGGAPEPFYPGVGSGVTATVASVRYYVAAGTSVTFNVQQGGTTVTGGSGLVAGSAVTTTTLGEAITDGTNLGIVVTAVSADNPSGLVVTLYVDLVCPVTAS